MKKMYLKLITICVALILSVAVVVVSSYAWLVLSGNPAASGIQVAIGGGNTILIAPDITKEVDGEIYHFPGTFTDNMNFSRYPAYDYLKDLEGLTPVSTADGVNWFLPAYYDYSDEEVRKGTVLSGSLKDVSDFYWDGELQHANIPAGNTEMSEQGSYIYLDFWVVSPGSNYTLRLSTGKDTGCFVEDLLQPQLREEAVEGLSPYTLAVPKNQAKSAMRIGFLANSVQLTDDSMLHYQESIFVDKRYTSLRGLYKEPNTGSANFEANRFTIYEPNADLHPTGMAEAGSYVRTMPIAMIDGEAYPVYVDERMTIQRSSEWIQLEGVATSEIEQRFQAATIAQHTHTMTEQEVSDYFYGEYLQWQLSPYVRTGKFIRNSASLKSFGDALTAEQFGALYEDGATEDVFIIKLERNVPQRIRMFVWLEGQDVDCINKVSASNFVINLELAGASEEVE